MNNDTLSQAKTYARQVLSEGVIHNYDLFSSTCIELKYRAGDPEASELLKRLEKLAKGSSESSSKESFYPWLFIFFIGVIVLIAIGAVLYFVVGIHFIWIGGVILAISLIAIGFKAWGEKLTLDKSNRRQQQDTQTLEEDSDYMVINCGACSHRYRIQKGQGIITTKCPSCGRQAKVVNELEANELESLTKEWIKFRDKFRLGDDYAISQIVEIEERLKNQYNIANPIKWLLAREKGTKIH